jgi:hypothetical protein
LRNEISEAGEMDELLDSWPLLYNKKTELPGLGERRLEIKALAASDIPRPSGKEYRQIFIFLKSQARELLVDFLYI